MKQARVVAAIAILGPFAWLFGSALLRDELFVFRDAAHFYHPLFQWSCRRWSEGELPLWNPAENCGSPTLAEASPSVFYPGKLVFALRLSYETRYKLYITGHVLLAAWAALHVARRWGASTLAAAAGALSYAYGGNVLFQYCNVVFLVGAAWLPWALLAADRMLVRRSVASALALGAVLALMTLGGDPEAAYHAMLLAILHAVFVRATRRRGDACGCESPALPRSCGRLERLASRRLSLLAVAAASGALLAACQILPAARWTRHSTRAASQAPRSLYEIPATVRPAAARDSQEKPRSAKPPAGAMSAIRAGLLGSPPRNEHHGHIYQFSVGPWRLAELLWPNVSGRLFPTHRRWLNVIPAEGRVWTPSLYMGLLPLLLGLGACRLTSGPPRVRWLSWSVLLFGLGSLGWYGLGWLIHEIRCSLLGAPAGDPILGEPVGGLYWMMVVALPGYAYFRYPAKLFVIASLGLSLLAARGWDRAFHGQSRVLQRALAAVGGLSLAAAAAAAAISPWWGRWMATVPADTLFGPLDPKGALQDLLTALLHTALLSSLLWFLMKSLSKSRNGDLRSAVSAGSETRAERSPWIGSRRAVAGQRRQAAQAALLLTAAELAAAHGWMAPTAPAQYWRDQPVMAQRIAAEEARTGGEAPFRLYRARHEDWLPAAWSASSSRRRLLEGLQWDRNTLFPKFHLTAGSSHRQTLMMIEAYGSITSNDFHVFMEAAREHGPRRADGTAEPHRSVLDALGAKYLVLPDQSLYGGMEQIGPAAGREVADAVLLRNPTAFPRAWIVHHVETLPPIGGDDPAAVERRTRRVLFPDGRPRDLRTAAVVESDLAWDVQAARPGGGDSCRIVSDQPQRVELEVALTAPGLVVLSDTYDPDWTARVAGQGDDRGHPAPVLRTNRVMRGIPLPAGRHRVVYQYRPRSFLAALALSALGWTAMLTAWIVAQTRTLRVRRAEDR